MTMITGVDYWQCKCGHVLLQNYHTKILPGVCAACERRQDGTSPFAISPRYGFRCDKRPRRVGSMWGISSEVHGKRDYGAILDCVCEMATQVAIANGWDVDKAINNVLKDEGWKILPTHHTAIRTRIVNDTTEVV